MTSVRLKQRKDGTWTAPWEYSLLEEIIFGGIFIAIFGFPVVLMIFLIIGAICQEILSIPAPFQFLGFN